MKFRNFLDMNEKYKYYLSVGYDYDAPETEVHEDLESVTGSVNRYISQGKRLSDITVIYGLRMTIEPVETVKSVKLVK